MKIIAFIGGGISIISAGCCFDQGISMLNTDHSPGVMLMCAAIPWLVVGVAFLKELFKMEE